jgi:hypothetical protein
MNVFKCRWCGYVYGLIFSLLIAGCATTVITSSWKDTAYTSYPDKILVLATAKSTSNKRSIEDEFVRLLTARGTAAVASYTVIPDEVQTDTTTIAAAMLNTSADALLVTRFAGTDEICTYESIQSTVYPSYYRTWRDYCSNIYAAGGSGSVFKDEYAVIETNLYTSLNENLVWSASSTTQMSGVDQRFIRSYTDVMIKTMASRKLLK